MMPQRSPKAAHRGAVRAWGLGIADAADAERDDEDAGEDERGEGHVPDPADGVLHGCGIERP